MDAPMGHPFSFALDHGFGAVDYEFSFEFQKTPPPSILGFGAYSLLGGFLLID